MIWRPRRLTLAAVLLMAAVPPGLASAQTQARVLYRPPAGVAGVMTVDIAVGVLQLALTQMQLQHRGETIRSVEVQPGTIDEVFERLKRNGLDPRADRMYGASGPEGTAIRGVLVIVTNKQRSSLIAVKSLRPSVIVDGGTTYLSGDGRSGEYSAVAAITGSADERTMRRAADALMVISLAGSLQGDVVYQRRFEEAVRSHRANAVKSAVPELARAPASAGQRRGARTRLRAGVAAVYRRRDGGPALGGRPLQPGRDAGRSRTVSQRDRRDAALPRAPA